MNVVERPFATKSEWVYEQLRRRILGGTYKPDDRLRLTELAREFAMSEMPVREPGPAYLPVIAAGADELGQDELVQARGRRRGGGELGRHRLHQRGRDD